MSGLNLEAVTENGNLLHWALSFSSIFSNISKFSPYLLAHIPFNTGGHEGEERGKFFNPSFPENLRTCCRVKQKGFHDLHFFRGGHPVTTKSFIFRPKDTVDNPQRLNEETSFHSL